ncbi:hypothetical protein QUB75_08555 [Microcoleus sp. K1-B6]
MLTNYSKRGGQSILDLRFEILDGSIDWREMNPGACILDAFGQSI